VRLREEQHAHHGGIMSQRDRLEAPIAIAIAPMTETKPLLRAWRRLVDM
jgi:hypothetical protein